MRRFLAAALLAAIGAAALPLIRGLQRANDIQARAAQVRDSVAYTAPG